MGGPSPSSTAWELFQVKCTSGQQGTGMKAKNLPTKQVILVLGFQAFSGPLQPQCFQPQCG